MIASCSTRPIRSPAAVLTAARSSAALFSALWCVCASVLLLVLLLSSPRSSRRYSSCSTRPIRSPAAALGTYPCDLLPVALLLQHALFSRAPSPRPFAPRGRSGLLPLHWAPILATFSPSPSSSSMPSSPGPLLPDPLLHAADPVSCRCIGHLSSRPSPTPCSNFPFFSLTLLVNLFTSLHFLFSR